MQERQSGNAAAISARIAKEQGFENLEDVIREGKQLKAGDKI